MLQKLATGKAKMSNNAQRLNSMAIHLIIRPVSFISSACFTMTGNGPSAAEFPVILKQSHNTITISDVLSIGVLTSQLSVTV